MMSVEWIFHCQSTGRRFLLSLPALVVAACVSFSFAPSVHAAKAVPDKSGLDILCKCDGCEYHGPTTKVLTLNVSIRTVKSSRVATKRTSVHPPSLLREKGRAILARRPSRARSLSDPSSS
jgi:hypothetical protein